jgi:ABC-type multidrug transport system fused ATPase/permease subunit
LPGKQNVTVQLTPFNFQSRFQTKYNLLFIFLVTIPPLIVFNRQIVAGMTAGGAKADGTSRSEHYPQKLWRGGRDQGINLTVKHGSFTAFVGPSGCGKSTLLRIIAGLEVQTSGALLIDGRDVSGAEPSERGIAMVFQSHAL